MKKLYTIISFAIVFVGIFLMYGVASGFSFGRLFGDTIGALPQWKSTSNYVEVRPTSTLVRLPNIASTTPVGINGATFYDTVTGKFRCYQAGSWTDCIGSGGGSATTTINSFSGPAFIFASGTPQTGLDFYITGSGSTITFSPQISSGYNIPLTASTTNWNNFYNTPSTRITDGTGLTWSGNTLNCDTASGSVQGCLTSADWTTFNNKQNALSFPLSVSNGGIGTTTLGNLTVGTNLSITGGQQVLIGTSTQISLGTAVVTSVSTTSAGSVFNASISSNNLALTFPANLLSTTTAAATYEPILTKGNLTANSPLSFDNTRQVIGGAAALSLGVVPIANGGTNTTTSPTLAGQLLGAHASGSWGIINLLQGAGITISTSTAGSITISSTLGTSVDLASEVTGVLPVANGGTATSTAPTQTGQLLGADGTGTKYAPVTLIQGSNVTITTSTPGTITISASLAGGAIDGSGVLNKVARFTDADSLSTGILIDNATVAGANATSSTVSFMVQGTAALNPFNVASSTGNSILFVGVNSRVGINTTTPANTLTVVGNSGNITPFVVASSTGTTLAKVDVTGRLTVNGIAVGSTFSTDDANNTLILTQFAGQGTNMLRVDNSGVVGIIDAVPVTNGGSGATTLTGMLKGNGTSAFTGVTGTIGQGTRWSDANTIAVGKLIDNGTVLGMNATSSTIGFNIQGTGGTNDIFNTASSSGTSFLKVTALGQILMCATCRATMPFSTAPTMTANGDFGLDTSNLGQFKVQATSTMVFVPDYDTMFGVGSTTIGTISGAGFGTATTTFRLGNPLRPKILNSFYCKTEGANIPVRIGDGTNWSAYLTASTSGAADTNPSNNTFTSREDIRLEAGTATSARSLTCTLNISNTSE